MPLMAQTVDGGAVARGEAPQVEVTPFFSVGSDFSSRVGADVAFRLAPIVMIGAEVGYRRNEMAAFSGNANVVLELPKLRTVLPYLATAIGLEQYGTPMELPGFGVVTRKNVGMTFSLGGGVKVPVAERWALRSDVRWLNPWGKPPEGWRIYNGATLRIGTR
jgi:hypothetical protein